MLRNVFHSDTLDKQCVKSVDVVKTVISSHIVPLDLLGRGGIPSSPRVWDGYCSCLAPSRLGQTGRTSDGHQQCCA